MSLRRLLPGGPWQETTRNGTTLRTMPRTISESDAIVPTTSVKVCWTCSFRSHRSSGTNITNVLFASGVSKKFCHHSKPTDKNWSWKCSLVLNEGRSHAAGNTALDSRRFRRL